MIFKLKSRCWNLRYYTSSQLVGIYDCESKRKRDSTAQTSQISSKLKNWKIPHYTKCKLKVNGVFFFKKSSIFMQQSYGSVTKKHAASRSPAKIFQRITFPYWLFKNLWLTQFKSYFDDNNCNIANTFQKACKSR